MRSYKANHINAMRMPYGWRLSLSGHHMVEPTQRKIIAKINAMRNSGYNLQAIAEYLNENKLPTSRNGKWHCSTIKKILDQNSSHFSKF